MLRLRYMNYLQSFITLKGLEDAPMFVGDEVDVTIKNGLIVIAPVRRIRGKQSLKELVSRIPKDYQTEEMDWGKPTGGEIW
jgi:antitoxin MazE